MSQDAVRAALAVFLLGVLGVWLIKPIGDPCPDVSRLPAGSQSSSAPSFAPPLTRTCTYTTPDGTKARKRYVPIVDWLIVAVVAGVFGVGVALVGSGAPVPAAERAPKPKPERKRKPERAPRPARVPRAARAPKPPPAKRAPRAAAAPRARSAPEEAAPQTAAERAAARERERQERAKRRESG